VSGVVVETACVLVAVAEAVPLGSDVELTAVDVGSEVEADAARAAPGFDVGEGVDDLADDEQAASTQPTSAMVIGPGRFIACP
jgi:hypothetical protein